MPPSPHEAPLTPAVLRQELQLFLQDVRRETQGLLREHFDEQLLQRLQHAASPRPLPDLVYGDAPRRRSLNKDATLNHAPTKTVRISEPNTGQKVPSITRCTEFKHVDGEAQSHSDENGGEAEDEDGSGLHPFLKRNPRCMMRRRANTAGSTISRTTMAAPDYARVTSRHASRHSATATMTAATLTWQESQDLTTLAAQSPRPAMLAPSEEQGPADMQDRETSRGSRELALAGGHETTASTAMLERDDMMPWHQVSACWISLRDIVCSPVFERLVGFLVVVNATMLGLETDFQWCSRDSDTGLEARVVRWLAMSEGFFCVLFVTELFLRLYVYRCHFFLGHDWGWNLFDLVVIFLQVFEQVTHIMVRLFARQDRVFLHALSILRIVRITRLMRLVRLLEELRTIMASICSSMVSLAWTFLLLMMLLYSSSLFFTEVVLQAGNTEHAEDLRHWYGGLGRTFLTMFECIFGGVSWDEVVRPVVSDISPTMGVIFCLYIAFCVLAMLNMATGVFVDNAMRKAQEDKDTNIANRISDLFFNDPELGQAESISYDQFCSKIDTPEMQDYFKAINVDPSEAKGLYRLLDADDSGAVDAEEMVSGCLRLRGGAKALELSLLTQETLRMNSRVSAFQARVERCLAWVVETLDQPLPAKAREPQTPSPPSGLLKSHTFMPDDNSKQPKNGQHRQGRSPVK